MPKFKSVVDAKLLKEALLHLQPYHGHEAVKFKAIKGVQKGTPGNCCGLFVGQKMLSEFEKVKKTFDTAHCFEGTIHRSAYKKPDENQLEPPKNKEFARLLESGKNVDFTHLLVLETHGDPVQLKEIAKACNFQAKLHYHFVAMKPGAPEPVPHDIDLEDEDSDGEEASAPPVVEDPDAKSFPDKLSAALPAIRQAERHPLAGRKVTELYERVVREQKTGQYPAAFESLLQLKQLVKQTLASPVAQPEKLRTERALQRQSQLQTGLADTLLNLRPVAFPKGQAVVLEKQAKRFFVGSGKEFPKMTAALRAVENDPNETNLQALEEAAKGYLIKARTESKPDDITKLKMAACQRALKDVRLARLAQAQKALGNPPWDGRQEAKAAQLQAQTLFEESLRGKAKPLGGEDGKGVNAAYFIEDKSGGAKFIFKPAESEESFGNGWPEQSGAVREVMAKSINDSIQEMTGLNLGVCPTHLVTLDNNKMGEAPDYTLSANQVGAMQELAKNRGGIRDVADEDGAAFFKRVPKADVQKIALLDFITMNFDRHGGNILVQQDDPHAPPRLVPIDHGKSLPTRESYLNGRLEISKQNWLLGNDAPGYDEKFSGELCDQIAKIDPEALASGMQATKLAVALDHPKMADKFADESVEMVRRSALFLKQAAPELTLKEISAAYDGELFKVFNAEPNAVDQAIKDAIARVKARSAGRQALRQFTDKQIIQELKSLGWFIGEDGNSSGIPDDQWLRDNSDRVPKILKGRIENPQAVQLAKDWIKQLGQARALDFNPDQFPLDQRIYKLGSLVRKKADQDNVPLIQEISRLFVNTDLLIDKEATFEDKDKVERDIRAFKVYRDHGGDGKLGGQSVATFDQKMAALINSLGGDAALKEMQKYFITGSAPRPADKVIALAEWKEFNDLGGVKELERLGRAASSKKNAINAVLGDFRSLKMNDAALQATDGLDLNKARDAALTRRLNILMGTVENIKDQAQKDLVSKSYQDALEKLKELRSDKKWDEAEKAVTLLELKIDFQLKGNDSLMARLEQRFADARKTIETLAYSEDREQLQKLYDAAKQLEKEMQMTACENALAALEKKVRQVTDTLFWEAERKERGEASQLTLMDNLLQAMLKKIAALKPSDPRSDLYAYYRQATEARTRMDIAECKRVVEEKMMPVYKRLVEKMKQP